ncbi:histone-like nucleoid-structuring protein Lsr2 [Arthrobacter sp. N1]|uniref:histone-like nucleoid-structuring protein Lsr2 n=1 Tax=Arthrobacter sp. N1 TaxID=619291 RepID=UPI003BAFF8E6
MAQRITIQLEDDLDGSEAAETVRFGLDGKECEVDLNEGLAEELRSALGRFVHASRGAAGRGQDKAPQGNSKRRASTAKEIRAWAKETEIAVNSRGRINEDVVHQYNVAQ